MNVCVITGRIVRDPELRHIGSGKAVTSFTVAVQREGKNDSADFVDCVAWEKTAEFVCDYFIKGQRIEVKGPLRTRIHERKDGTKQKITEILCERVMFGESKNANNNSVDDNSDRDDSGFSICDISDDDLPF